MRWSRVKTILIIMLMALNAYLLGSLIVQYRATAYLSADMARRASTLLSERGVTVAPEDIPLLKPALNEASVMWGRELGEKILEALGDSVIINGNPGENNSAAENAVIAAYDGTFETVYGSNGFVSIIDGYGVSYRRTADGRGGGSPHDAVRDFMAGLGLARGDYDIAERDGAYILTQHVNGVPLFVEAALSVTVENGVITGVEGCVALDALASSGGSDVKDAVNMLFLLRDGGYFVEYVSPRITSMKLGYKTAVAVTGRMALEPVWRVEISGETRDFDGASGRPR